jgi:hypothetical protein
LIARRLRGTAKLRRRANVVAIGAVIPLAFGRETVGQLETVTEGVPALA